MNVEAAATSIHLTVGEVLASLTLVALAAAISFWQRADLEQDIAVAVARSAVQLNARVTRPARGTASRVMPSRAGRTHPGTALQ